MPIIDDIRDRVTSIFPKSKSFPPKPRRSSLGVGGGLGYGEAERDPEEDMIISKPAIVFHACEGFFSFLAMATFASCASFQAKWIGGASGLSGLSIFVALFSLFLCLFLLAVPVIYEKYDKLNRLARALKEDRVAFILVGAGTTLTALLTFVTLISAWTQPGCKNADNDPNAKLGDQFKEQLGGFCASKRAGSIFFLFTFVFWCASLFLVFRDWRSGKTERERTRNLARDPPFIHPESGSGYAPDLEHDDDEGEHEYVAPGVGYDAPPDRRGAQSAAPQIPPLHHDPSPFADPQPRQSMDAYGAFSDPAPSSYAPNFPAPQVRGTSPSQQAPVSPGTSRTMQYADPYAAVTASLHRSSASPSPERGGGQPYNVPPSSFPAGGATSPTGPAPSYRSTENGSYGGYR